MGKFGEVAIKATCILISREVSEPREAWRRAARALGCSQSTTKKSCPLSAYLGLCEAGLVKGAPQGRHWTKSVDNKRYAVNAVNCLRNDESWFDRPTIDLWREVSKPQTITHNGQIDVVFGLWEKKLISN